MKTIKSFLIAATLISATVVSTLSAQQDAQPAKQHEWKVAIGDSVMIKRECQEYLTGERPSVWVWDKVHTVRQLGTKRFPNGVLLMNIYSWMCEDCLIPVNGVAQQAAAQAAEEQAEEKAAAVKAGKVKPDPVSKPSVKPGMQPTQGQQAAQAGKTEQAQETEMTKAEKEAQKAGQIKAQTPVQAVGEAQAAEAAEEVAEEPAAEEAVAEEAQPAEEPVAEESKAEEEPAEKAKKAGYHRFTIGVRGGAASLLHKSDAGKWGCGGDAVLDLQYAHYWTKEGRPVDLGIITGLGIGYAQSNFYSNVNSSQKNVSDGDADFPMTIDYTITSDKVNENDGQLQLEVPLMFSLIHENGLFFNFGPKFMLPVFTPYNQRVSDNTHITAYIQQLGVSVTDDEIMGQLAQADYTQKGNDYKNQFTINVMLTAEIGYEWTLKSGNSLGLGAFANYSVFNSFKDNTNSAALISVVTPPSGDDNAVVKVNPLTESYAKGLGFFDAGVKLAYHFNFPKKGKACKVAEEQLATVEAPAEAPAEVPAEEKVEEPAEEAAAEEPAVAPAE